MIPIKYDSRFEPYVHDFLVHSRDTVGCVEGTIYNRSYHVRRFLAWLTEQGIISIEEIQPMHSVSYVKFAAEKFEHSTMRNISTILRTFFYYLRMKGLGHSKLADAVMPIRSVRLRSVPTYLSVEQETKFLAAFKRNTPEGKRNYAMAMCMIRLGLRCCETQAIQLDDIDWKNAVIAVRNVKCRRIDHLPLVAEVGAALEDYILNSRPKTDAKHVFVKFRLGKGQPMDPKTPYHAIAEKLSQFGIDLPRKGTHALRRTVASRLIQNGASIKEVADILRHRNINTTMLYSKINIPLLQQIAMPWPAVNAEGRVS